jgi:RES domain-containing protein
LSITVWRIATDAPAYEADDLSGAGGKLTGGRWNEAGIPVVYASEARALACLETVVHLNAAGLPLNRYLVAVTIPDDIWAKAQREDQSSLSIGWDALPAGRVSIAFGTNWLVARTTALLIIPSAIVPEEFNILINPQHTDTTQVAAAKVRKWTYDPRLG